MEEMKTYYEWCLEKNIRILNLESPHIDELEFYTQSVDEKRFENFLGNISTYNGVEIQEGKLHLKSDEFLELRMYSLVPYNILGIQMGIQHEHSVNEYVRKHVIEQIEGGAEPCDKYVKWVKHWKTSILLNGGTTNEGSLVTHGYGQIEYLGSMQSNLLKLRKNNIKCSSFHEPDLNNALTGISFIVDERVFNKRLYKDFVPTEMEDWAGIDPDDLDEWNAQNRAKWVEKIGGEKNDFLRTFLSGFKLARG